MFAVGTLGNYITQGVFTVAGPFHPFGGAVDIIVVQQKDGTFKSSPWYVKFGKFQGVLTRREKVVDVTVNDIPTDFHMFLDHKGEAYFEKEVQCDEETVLSLPSAGASGDGIGALARHKRLTYSKDSITGGLEMQEVPSRDSATKAAGTVNEYSNAKSGTSDNANIADAETASQRNRPDHDVAQVLSETKEQNGTLNSDTKNESKEQSKAERSGRRLAKLSKPMFGLRFGRKSPQSPTDTSAQGVRRGESVKLKSSLSLERAELIADLLDRKWVTGCREILLTPSKRWHSTEPATGVASDSLQSVETGSMTNGLLGCEVVMNEAALRQSESGDFTGPEVLGEGSKQSVRDNSNFMETRSLIHGSEGCSDATDEASSGHLACEELSRPEIHTKAPALVDLQADMMTSENLTKSRELRCEEPWRESSVLDSAAGEQTSTHASNESSGDASSHSDRFCKPTPHEEDKNGTCNVAHTGNEQVTLVGTAGAAEGQRMEGLPSPGVVLVSGDGHIIVAPTDAECGPQFESSEVFSIGASRSHDAQVEVSSSCDLEVLEAEKSKHPAAVSVSSTVMSPEVNTDSGLDQLSRNSGGLVRIDEVPAGLLDCEIDGGRASELSPWNAKSTSNEMVPEFASELKFKASKGNTGASFQHPELRSEKMIMTFLPAANESWEEGKDCVLQHSVIRDLIAGQSDEDLHIEAGTKADQSGTAGCLPEDAVRDIKNLATPRDNMFSKKMTADSKFASDVDLSQPNIELHSGLLQSSGQQMLEQFYSFKEGHMVELNHEDSEDDDFKNCLYLEEVPNCGGDDNVVAFLEVDDSVFKLGDNGQAGEDLTKSFSQVNDITFEERHNEQNLSSCKSEDPEPREQLAEARSGTFTLVSRSKPIPVPFTIKKKAELISSASVPCRLCEAKREKHAYSRSVGSTPLYNVTPVHARADATNTLKKDIEESISVVDLEDMQVIQAIIYGSGKDSELIVDAPNDRQSPHIDVDLSLCRHLLSDGMGADAAAKAFALHRVTYEEFRHSGSAVFADDKLVVKIGERYLSWVEAAPYILDMGGVNSEAVHKIEGGIAVGTNDLTDDGGSQAVATTTPTTGWTLWPFSVRRSGRERSPLSASTIPKQALLTATNLAIASPFTEEILRMHGYHKPTKLKVPTYVPTSQQLASLRLKEGSNKVTFAFSSPVIGKTQVDARIYLWKWNTRIVVSDVDGTITRSDVLGQVMPLVGRDWTQSGVTRLFSAIKDNGYELLFLSARAISQAYLTRQFLLNLKQDGAGLPDGPVFISPDGLIPSFYREVIRRAPHEFKITCLEGIRELFPSDINPFYAGFGNRDTDEISYLKVGIPKGKIFIINPKGEVAVNHLVDSKSYSSLHTLVDDMFPPMSLCEQEDFNSWNFWKLPLPDIDDELSMNSAKSTRRTAGSRRAV